MVKTPLVDDGGSTEATPTAFNTEGWDENSVEQLEERRFNEYGIVTVGIKWNPGPELAAQLVRQGLAKYVIERTPASVSETKED